MDFLAPDEVRENDGAARRAIMGELQRCVSLRVFQRFPKDQAKDAIDARWVLKWKQVYGVRLIKARLTVRGMKGLQRSHLAVLQVPRAFTRADGADALSALSRPSGSVGLFRRTSARPPCAA